MKFLKGLGVPYGLRRVTAAVSSSSLVVWRFPKETEGNRFISVHHSQIRAHIV